MFIAKSKYLDRIIDEDPQADLKKIMSCSINLIR